jgi:hypothetical protein
MGRLVTKRFASHIFKHWNKKWKVQIVFIDTFDAVLPKAPSVPACCTAAAGPAEAAPDLR